MAFDAFLKIEGMDGESNDRVHKGEIEISSFSWGLANTIAAGGGGATGRAVLQDFHFTMPASKASPNLMLSCATGRHFSQVALTCRKAGGSQIEFLKIKLQDVLVSSYDIGGTDRGEKPDDVPFDQLSLSFVKIDFLYTVEKTGETVETFFDNSRPT
jgi:type VI secretion system secreted protein Hcp